MRDEMLLTLQSAFGFLAILAIACLLSVDRRALPWRIVISGTLLQIVLAAALLKLPLFRDVFVQTFGDLVNFNPHLHVLAADGAFLPGGRFVALPRVPERLLRRFGGHPAHPRALVAVGVARRRARSTARFRRKLAAARQLAAYLSPGSGHCLTCSKRSRRGEGVAALRQLE